MRVPVRANKNCQVFLARLLTPLCGLRTADFPEEARGEFEAFPRNQKRSSKITEDCEREISLDTAQCPSQQGPADGVCPRRSRLHAVRNARGIGMVFPLVWLQFTVAGRSVLLLLDKACARSDVVRRSLLAPLTTKPSLLWLPIVDVFSLFCFFVLAFFFLDVSPFHHERLAKQEKIEALAPHDFCRLHKLLFGAHQAAASGEHRTRG